MLVDFAERLLEALPDEVQLYSRRLHETATSYAEWFADDNLSDSRQQPLRQPTAPTTPAAATPHTNAARPPHIPHAQ